MSTVLVGSVCAGLVVLVTVWLRTVRFRRLFAFDVRADQDPCFARHGEHAARGCDVDLEEWGFVWPRDVGDVGAVVLELRVAATLRGWLWDPWVEAIAGDGPRRSYIERGAAGRRLLLLGDGALGAPGASIRLRAGGVRWGAGRARLWLSPRQDVWSGRTLVVAPHSDDAELAAFSLFGPETWVVTVTAGERGTFPLPGFLAGSAAEAWARCQRRAADSVSAAWRGGVGPDRVVLLGYFDGTLPAMWADPDAATRSEAMPERDLAATRGLHTSSFTPPVPVAASWNALVADFEALLDAVKPTRVVTPHPNLDRHGDHRLATVAVLTAMHGRAERTADLMFYANHRHGSVGSRNPQPVGAGDGLAPLCRAPASDEPHYSFPVSVPIDAETRDRKCEVLEHMVDLAQHDMAPPSGLRRLRKSLSRAFHAVLTYDLSFLRRNVRPNEVFFFVPASAAQRFSSQILAGFDRPSATRSAPSGGDESADA